MKKVENNNLINNIRSIEDLSKFDNIFRSFAKKITKNDVIYNDLVNDMYIKLHDSFNTKKIECIKLKYALLVINNKYIDYLRKKNNSFQFEDYQNYDIEDDSDQIIADKIEDEKLYSIIEERMKDLTWFENKIYEMNKQQSLRTISKNTKISVGSLFKTTQSIKKKLGVIK